MWTFASKSRLVASVWSSLAVWLAAAAVFYWVQTQVRPVGGNPSLAKSIWLAYAVLFWIVLPALITADSRLSPTCRRPFVPLLLLMLARGPAELWMLYISLNWSPWYGIGQDLVCAAALVLFGWRLWAAKVPRSSLQRTILVHLAVTALMFGPEVYFAWYMQAHFNTKGSDAIYFVPDDPAHSVVLNVTTAVVVFLTAYLPVFLMRWLHGTPKRDHQIAI